MSTQPPAPGLDKLQSELARGDIDAVRRTFLLLNEREIAIVVAEVGEDELVRIVGPENCIFLSPWRLRSSQDLSAGGSIA